MIRDMTTLRSFAAVIAGYVVFAVSAVLLFQLSGRDPHAPQSAAFVTVTMVYGMVFAVLGGAVTVRVARVRPMLHATLLAALIALGAAVSLLASPGAGATWSQWGAILLMAPCALLAPRLTMRAPVTG
jgi:hypothetical protein